MVTDSQFPHCPIRNILARVCQPDALWMVLQLGDKGEATKAQLVNSMANLSVDEIENAINLLAADNLITQHNGYWHLTKTGLSLLPRAKNMVRWCEQNFI